MNKEFTVDQLYDAAEDELCSLEHDLQVRGLSISEWLTILSKRTEHLRQTYEKEPAAERLAETTATELLGGTVPLNSLRLIGRYANRHRVLVSLIHEGIKVDNLHGQDTLLTWRIIEAANSDLINVLSVTIRSLADTRDDRS